MKNLRDTGSYLKEKAEEQKILSFKFRIAWFIGILFMGVAYIFGSVLLFVLGLFLFGIGCFSEDYHKSHLRYHKGLQGEKTTTRALQKLSDKYLLINDIKVPNGYGNIDHVVLGENGIFVIETKNIDGDFICDGNDWYRNTGGGLYQVKSPITQVKKNALKLNEYIKSKNILNSSRNLWIDRIIVFTSDNFSANGTSTVHCLLPGQLCDHIQNKKINIKFSYQELDEIGKHLLLL